MKKKNSLYLLLLFLITLVALFLLARPITPAKVVEYYMVYPQESSSTPAPENAVAFEGCGTEYLVKVASNKQLVGGLAESLTELLSIDSLDYDGTDYTNALYLSNGTVLVTENEQAVTVDINGQIMSAGTCDDPRIKAQIIETIKLYTLDKPYVIRLNGSSTNWDCLGDMSGECQ